MALADNLGLANPDVRNDKGEHLDYYASLDGLRIANYGELGGTKSDRLDAGL